ncbi:MAG: AAA family ATPase, partial [Nanopusillaceae archaeon]
MKLYSIKLENFKLYKEKAINFDDKNIIIGENGAGKTSIFQAILYALFGKDSLQYLDVNSVENLIRYTSTSATIILEFGDENKRYLVERKINRYGENLAVLYEGEKSSVIASGTEIVNKKIREILNIRKADKFGEILYIKQGDLGRYISLSGKIELTKKLESLFDIEYYSIILKVIEGLLRDLEKEKEYLEREKNSLFKDIITYRELFGNKDISQLLEEAKRYEELKRLREMIYKDYIELKTLENEIDYSLLSQENYLLNKLNELIEKEKILKENIIDLESEKKNLKYEKVSEDLLKDSIDILEKRKAELEIYKNMNEKELEIDIKNAKELLNDLEEISRYYDIESEYQKIKEDIERIKREKILIDNKNRE